ncbi:hypothetical protein PPERSA_05649 [Pseudocohnilembus persalinus]|uniref:Uncharacterized protein n=1 Tax=Pseudocohnilembus persalinus TaxID=266149 RepID=A0A0V0QQ79_PSEPJ|nr:hypothetical protein PPERSA_05649 [Pseudocohnilembus persalinus]|eukprot:KRX04388.1 hypothetical protein PPERSA_05649 [Pseudocohnilembus persalinus]
MSTDHYWSNLNYTPGTQGGQGSIYRGGNVITTRGNEQLENLPSQKRSQNMAQASMKVLRWYRKACRLMPFILRIHNLNSKVSSVGAMKNLQDQIHLRAHYRDPSLIDDAVGRAYELTWEAEYQITQHTYLYQYICPPWKAMGDRGYSYLEKVKNEGKTKFLSDFYKNTQNY